MSARTLRRWLAACCTLIAGALTLSPASSAIAAPAGLLLPDLRLAPPGCQAGAPPSKPCDDWDVCLVADAQAPSSPCLSSGPAKAVRLRFTSAAENAGDGPLLLYGSRDNTATPAM